MVNKITRYIGRNGNNLLQILSTIYLIKKNNILHHVLEIDSHPLFELKSSIIKKQDTNNSKYSQTILFNAEFLLKLSIDELKNLFKEYVIYKNKIEKKIFDIGIHIRSGDIFENTPHELYFQPPLFFYKKIIDENIDKSIVIVFENKSNPIINILIDLYKNNKNIVFQSSSVYDDILTLSNSKILVFSVGTFPLIPYVISDSIEKIIYPDYLKNNNWFTINNNNAISIELPNYILKQWENTDSQKKHMINYNINML